MIKGERERTERSIKFDVPSVLTLAGRLPVEITIGRKIKMLWTIVLILLIMWALGFGFAGQSLGSLVHVLLVVAVIVLILQLIRGRRL